MGRGINFLYEEYKKDPSRVEKLLGGKIEITENLDASRFSVQTEKGRELRFFKRKDTQITKIDRTLAKYYEKAIYHFENLPEETLDLFPDGWRFNMEYFPNLQPVTITYDRLPLNNLVLTSIQVKDPKDKTLDIITDKDTLTKWADILEVEKPPIIFEGELSDKQKRKILDFLNTSYDVLIQRFKTENFTMFILTLLNSQLKSSFLNNNLEKDIDGLIFKFDGKEAFRVSNPEIALAKSVKRDEKPSDIYNLTLVILQEFMLSLDFKKIKLREKSFEDRYIEFICRVFNLFIQSSYYKNNFNGELDFELPQFLTRKESGVNFQFVKDEETQQYLKESNTNRELFKILMASMRTHKKKPSGFFSKELLFHHNSLVDKIADYINCNIKESFFTFDEFRNVFLTEGVDWQEEFGKEPSGETEKLNEVSLFPDFGTVVKPIEQEKAPEIKPKNSDSVLKKLFSEKPVGKTKKKMDICTMKGKFIPFHNGHEACINDANEESGNKVFLLVTLPRNEHLGISKELQRLMLDEVVKNNPNVCGYKLTEGKSWNEILKDFPSDYNFKAFSGSIDECEDLECQLGEEITSIPSTRHLSSKSILEKIKTDDYDGFKKLVPHYLHNYFYKIKNEMND